MTKAPSPTGRRSSARTKVAQGGPKSGAPSRTATAKPKKATKKARKRATKTPTRTFAPEHGVDLSELSTGALETLIEDAIAEMGQRRLEDLDPEALINEGFEVCFRGEQLVGPKIIKGFVLVPGYYLEKSGGNHDCHLFTIRESEESSNEWWAWDDDTGRMKDSRTVFDGKLRRTVSLYLATPGLMVIGHNRRSRYEPNFGRNTHKYVKSGLSAYKVVMPDEHDEDGEPRLMSVPGYKARPLPRPETLED